MSLWAAGRDCFVADCVPRHVGRLGRRASSRAGASGERDARLRGNDKGAARTSSNALAGCVFAALLLVGCVSHAPGGSVSLAIQGDARTRVVIADDATETERYAAEELQRFLGQMIGAEIPVVTAGRNTQYGDIVIGRAARGIDTRELGDEGYRIETRRGRVYIAGGEPRGTLYGVYALLEDYLGCRWYTPEVSRIPRSPSVILPAIDVTHVPVLEYREPFTADCRDGDWAARNRMNSSAASLEARHGGKVTYFGFVHTFESLVPPATYFDAHPEYFSLVDGKRLRDRSQLCTTNEDVIRIITDEVRKRMREHPEAMVFSVSQNDWYNYCECDRCTAMAEAEGSQIAPVLYLVNRVADAVRDEFPDKLIDTLAYQWTRKPPKSMRPAENVVVRLCSIECCFAHSFEQCDSPENRAFVEDVKGWSRMCDRLWVWDYVTSFAHYLTPFPNLRLRGDNIRFFARHNVTGIFEQDVYTTKNGELSGLSGYLGAKLLWNPERNDAEIVAEYLAAVYGSAAPHIQAYIDLIHDHAERENTHVMIWAGPSEAYLTDALLDEADRLWDAAERAAAEDGPEVLARVQTARLSVDYAIIERARQRGDRPYSIDHARYTVTPQPEFRARTDRFFAVGERSGIESLRESTQTLADYAKLVEPMMRPVTLTPVAPVKPVGRLQAGLNYAYYEGQWDELPDFDALTPVVTGWTGRVSLDAAPATDAMAMEFEGYIEAPADGVYTFGTRSNDGSQVFIGDRLVVDNGGRHTMQGQSGFIALKKGLHPLRVTYFQAGALSGLEFFYAGPGIEMQTVPVTAMWRR